MINPSTHFSQCSIYIPPENVRKPNDFMTLSKDIEMEHWTNLERTNVVHFETS